MMHRNRNQRSLIPLNAKRFYAVLEPVKDKTYPVVHKYLLDDFSERDIEATARLKAQLEFLIKSEWLYFHDQRRRKFESIKNAFNDCLLPKGFQFENQYRCVGSKYQDCPLSSKGSILSTRGGRFNIGKLADPFTPFPGLYIAEDPDTARSEAFQSDYTIKKKYSANTFALQKSEKSHSIARINGFLKNVVDLSSDKTLKRFVKVLKKILPSEEIKNLSKNLGIIPHGTVTNVKGLSSQLFDKNWSYYPTNFELPHNSQDFGCLARDSGIQGLIYKSKYGGGKCLVIFPENLKDCDVSFVQLSDESPPSVITKINSFNYTTSYD